MSTVQKRGLAQSQEGEDEGEISISAPIHDRSSTFVAHYHPHIPTHGTGGLTGSKPTSLTSTIKSLQSHEAFSSADHRIVAWRRRSAQTTLSPHTGTGPGTSTIGRAIYTTGSDDDGEKYAGKRLERVLSDLDVEGAVVVARWYGGVLLGPVRFTHIEHVAREAIGKWKANAKIGTSFSGGRDGDGAKRQKTEAVPDGQASGADIRDEADRARLAKQLSDRDNSIVVLRGLLAEKTQKGPAADPSPTQSQNHTSSQGSSSPAKTLEYTEMPLARLRQLERARDATIAFILRELDKVEQGEMEKEKEERRGGDGGEENDAKQNQTSGDDKGLNGET